MRLERGTLLVGPALFLVRANPFFARAMAGRAAHAFFTAVILAVELGGNVERVAGGAAGTGRRVGDLQRRGDLAALFVGEGFVGLGVRIAAGPLGKLGERRRAGAFLRRISAMALRVG